MPLNFSEQVDKAVAAVIAANEDAANEEDDLELCERILELNENLRERFMAAFNAIERRDWIDRIFQDPEPVIRANFQYSYKPRRFSDFGDSLIITDVEFNDQYIKL